MYTVCIYFLIQTTCMTFFENSKSPGQLASNLIKPADQDLHSFHSHNESILIMKLHMWTG